MKKTKIEWADETDNLFVVVGQDGKQLGWYCQKVSPGCVNCYAERVNMDRFGNGLPYRAPRDGVLPPLMFRRELMDRWPRQRKTKVHFVNSMTDTFGEFILDDWIFEALDGMAAAPLQIFMLLTKRSARMAEMVNEWMRQRQLKRMPQNIYCGVSVETQKMAQRRIPDLITINGTLFISAEPLLEMVDLSPWLFPEDIHPSHGRLTGDPLLHLVIAGGESGPGARVMRESDALLLRDQCREADVPFFFKQWGEWVPEREFRRLNPPPFGYKTKYVGGPGDKEGGLYFRIGRRFSGRMLDSAEYSEMPEFPCLTC